MMCFVDRYAGRNSASYQKTLRNSMKPARLQIIISVIAKILKFDNRKEIFNKNVKNVYSGEIGAFGRSANAFLSL
jgi:hypothetical protein